MTDVGTARLVEQLGSPDTNERALALAGLVRLGRAASPALRGALEDGPEHVRAQAAQALAEIADPATVDELAVHTRDGNPDVRAHAALGLARVRDRRATDALVRTIDDLPDIEHHPYSLSVYGLIDLGLPALPSVVPLLSAVHATTRQRAFEVVRATVTATGWDWPALWTSLGRYDPDTEPAEREAAAAQWAAWCRANC
jgi:HEAT repeat protein